MPQQKHFKDSFKDLLMMVRLLTQKVILGLLNIIQFQTFKNVLQLMLRYYRWILGVFNFNFHQILLEITFCLVMIQNKDFTILLYCLI